jgi:EAL domain-containing protein (putative c-di-GMP-specific phosphodiesterase class I)
LVAEGIETAQEEKLLRELECELGQGFLFSRPVTYDTLYTLLEKANYVKV